MNFSEIKYCDIANGEGVRTTLFVSGCRLHCPGCFNQEAQDFAAGEAFTQEVEERILESLEPGYIDGLTLLGGEPMEPENQEGLVGFVERVKERFPEKSIWCFTGYVLEDLLEGGRKRTDATERLLACIDILVDGPFLEDQHDITLRFMGSSNQRIIDIPAMREAGEIRLWQDDPSFATHTME